MRRFVLSIVMLAMAFAAVAAPVGVERARQVGANWLSLKGYEGAVKLEAMASPFAEVYVFNAADGGFVLVAADDCARPVLGYSLSGAFRVEALPANVRSWLEDYCREIGGAKGRGEAADAIAAEWRQLAEGVVPGQPLATHVAPLLTTIWNQSPLYNDMCPYDTVYGQLTVAGCVATATAQIMKYWNHPYTGYGTHAYDCNNGRISYGVLSADFGNTTYQWLSMPNALTSASSQTEIDAVATLIYHVGVASNMRYNVSAQGGSGTYNHSDYYPSAMSALVEHFKYAPDIVVVAPGIHNADAYSAMLRAELDLQRPILYDGRDASGGHSFVCDGYEEANMFHFNWGWGGYCDGYYALGALNPAPGGTGGNATYTFNMNNTAMLQIRPNNMFGAGGSVTVNTVGGTTGCTVSGDGIYDFGDTVTLQAVAAEGYRFAGWSDNSTANPRSFTMTGGNYTFTARFETIGSDTMSYCGDMPFCSYWGEQQEGFDKYWGIKLPASALTPGRTLSAVEFYVGSEYVGGQFDVTVYSGTTAPTDTVYSTSLLESSYDMGSWLPVFLHTPYTVEAGKSIWITLHNNDILFPATLTYSCGNPDGFLYGPAFNPDPEWTSYSFMIRGLFTTPGIVADGDTLSYCGDRPYTGTIGPVEWGIMIPAAELAGRNYLQAVKLFAMPDYVYSLRVYKGGDDAPRTLVHSQPTVADAWGWHEIVLDAMVPISAGDSLWITFTCPGREWDNLANMCRYTGMPNSDWLCMADGVWYHDTDYDQSDYSWMIKAVTSATAPVLPPPTVVISGDRLVGVGDTATFTAVHSAGTTVAWAIQGGTPATATGDTVTVSWSQSGFYRVSATVTNANGSATDSMMVSVADCDSISLPYTADFTQCWSADGGAVIADHNTASVTSQGQRLTSPWLMSQPGMTFISFTTALADGVAWNNNAGFNVTVEDENGILAEWGYSVESALFTPAFYSNGGRFRVVFEYVGSVSVPSFRIENINVYQYDISVTMDLPAMAAVGDTVTMRINSTLQNNDRPDHTGAWMYDIPNYNNNYSLYPHYDDSDSTVTVVAQSDSSITLVWNREGGYEMGAYVRKNNVYNGHSAQVDCYEIIRIMANPIYEEDSIYYTSAARDTVIGSHRLLHNAVLPASVTVIKDSAFFKRGNLASVSLPDGLEYIGKMAFAMDNGLAEVTIPRGVKFIDDNAFWNCTMLNTVNFNADSCLAASPTTESNGSYWPVFIGCNNVRTINIGENVKRIPDRLFSYCNGLQGTLTIPDEVTYIGTNAFYHWDEDNTAPMTIVIGSSVSYIGNYALECHDHLSAVISRSLVPPTIAAATFMVYQQCTLTVPCGTRSAYLANQYWHEFEQYGSGIEEDCTGIEDAVADGVRVYAVAGGIVVEGAADGPVCVFDVMGRCVAAVANAKGIVSVPQAGVYMVRIGEQATRKVVVLQ